MSRSDVGKQKILDVLHKTFGTDTSGKADFNSVTLSALAADLTQKDPSRSGPALAIVTTSSQPR